MARTGKIYDQIDALAEARTVGELAAKLQPILNELAYYVVTGEGVVMETHEEWHTDFTDRLYDAVADDKKGGARAPAAATAWVQSPGPKAQKTGSGARPQGVAPRRPPEGGFAGGSERGPLPVPTGGGRPRPADLSPTLRSIMEGTHPSFTEADYH
jgi:hypothetical protein